jgi:hypothetical protein
MGQQQPGTFRDGFDPHQRTYIFDYHWLAFYQRWLEGRNLKPHHLRDGPAFRELCVALDDRGGRFGKIIHNGPATPGETKKYREEIQRLVEMNQDPLIEDVVKYRVIDQSFLKPGQVLVVSTRVPMNDFQQEDKVQVQPGFTSIEQKVIRACRAYLEVCSRKRVRLSTAVAGELPAKYANRADVIFRVNHEPWYTTLTPIHSGARVRRTPNTKKRTAAYLLQLPAVPELNGADLLVMWGQGGTQTLAFAQRLRTDLSGLLDHYGLSMVEMAAPAEQVPPREPPREAVLLEYAAEEWETKVLLDGVLLDPSGKRVAPQRKVRRGSPIEPGPGPSSPPGHGPPAGQSAHPGG